MRIIFAISMMLSVFTNLAHSTTYYVDERLSANCDGKTYHYDVSSRTRVAGAGQISWKSMHLANTTMTADDICYIRGGTSLFDTMKIGYTGTDTEGINPQHSGTDASHRITYSVYNGEKVMFYGNDPYATAVWITNRNWIRVTGYDGSTSALNIKFYNMYHYLTIQSGSNYNEISYCEFAKSNANTNANNIDACGRIIDSSSYNWVHNCSFHDLGGYNGTDPASSADVGNCLDIGWEDCGYDQSDSLCHDQSAFNVVENNLMYHGGHQIMLVAQPKNVIRNNVFHNEQWYHAADSLWYGYRIIYTNGRFNSDYHLGYNLFESNRISHSTNNMNASTGGEGIHLATSNNIIRYNDFYALGSNALYIEEHHEATTGRINYNHIYNNTFYANGYEMTQPDAYGPFHLADIPDRVLFYFVSGNSSMSDSIFAKSIYGNVIKNNIAWKNRSYFACSGRYDQGHGWGFSGCSGETVCGNTVFDHNDSINDPKFVTVGSYGNPKIDSTDFDWYWGNSTPNGSDIYIINTEPNFNLQASSPNIDAGTYLTQANGAGNNSTSLVVGDVKYFQPGWGNGAGGGASVQADWIAVGTVSNTVQISSIDYGTNTITLASPMTWANNDPVWLYKKSDGEIVLSGTAPDCGAHEYLQTSIKNQSYHKVNLTKNRDQSNYRIYDLQGRLIVDGLIQLSCKPKTVGVFIIANRRNTAKTKIIRTFF